MIMNESPELKSNELPHDARDLIYTPATVNGIEGNAMVYSGASAMFISQRFVRDHNLRIEPRSCIIKDGKGSILAQRIVVVSVIVCNGKIVVPCEADVMEMPRGRDLVIGH